MVDITERLGQLTKGDCLVAGTMRPSGEQFTKLMLVVQEVYSEAKTEIERLRTDNKALTEALEKMWDSACTNARSTPSKSAFLKARAALDNHGSK